MIDDAELLRSYVEDHSETAFAQLVRRHLTLVYSSALRQLNGDTHLAKDVAQEVFSALARKAASLSDRRSLAGWLYLGAHHAATQVVRSERRRHAREQEAHTMHEFSARPEPASAAIDWEQVRPVLDAAMRELGEVEREAVLLRYFEHRPFSAIGSSLKLSEDAARMRVDRALDKLRALLGRRGIVSSSAALAGILGNQAMIAAPSGLASFISGNAIAATAATTTAVTLATGIFMTKSTLTLTAVGIVAIGAAFFFGAQTKRSERALAEAHRELAALRIKAVGAEQRGVAAEQRSTALTKQISEARELKNPSPPVAAGRTTPEAQPQWTGYRLSDDRAEALRQARAMSAASMEARYAAFFRQTALTPEQIEQFINLKLDLAEKSSDAFKTEIAAARKADPSIDRAGMQKIFEQNAALNRTEVEAEIRNTFGAEFQQKMVYFESNVAARQVAGQLAETLYYTASPLTPGQADQLVEVIAKQPRDAQSKIDIAAVDVGAVLEEAKTILSPTQLIGFRQTLVREMQKITPERRLLDGVQSASAFR